MNKLKNNETLGDFARFPYSREHPVMPSSDFDGDLIPIPQISDVCRSILKICGLDTKKYMRYGKKQTQKYLNDQMNIVRSTITEMAIRKTVCINTFMLANGTQNMSFALPNKQTVSAIVSTGSVMNYLWKLSPHGVQILSQRDTQPKIGEKHITLDKFVLSPNRMFAKRFGKTNNWLIVYTTEVNYSTGSVTTLTMVWVGKAREKYLRQFIKYSNDYCMYIKKAKKERFKTDGDSQEPNNFECGSWVENESGYMYLTERAKTLPSIIMKKEYKDTIKQMLYNFGHNSLLYEQFGIDFKLGILLYGEPGTGKSSIARSIYWQLSRNYCCNLLYPDISKPDWVSSLNAKINEIQGSDHSNELFVVVIEDIDVLVSTNRDKEKTTEEKARFSNLLKLLDGHMVNANCVYIATTNRVKDLEKQFDGALIRDGRMDIKIHIGEFNEDLAEQMAEYFTLTMDQVNTYAKKVGIDLKYPIKPAALQNICMNTIIDMGHSDVTIGDNSDTKGE